MFRFLYKLWTADPHSTRDEKRREQEDLRQQDRERITEKQQRDERQDTEELLTILVVTEEIRRVFEDLQRDIDDAIRTVRIAHERALREQQAAREALEAAQRSALVVSDGRRVYFTADGRLLFSEDHREITGDTVVEEARRLHETQSDATTYETYLARWQSFADAEECAQSLATTLDKLDDLDRRLAAGLASEDEVAETRAHLDEIIADLPAAVSHDYERIHEQRTAPAAADYEDEADSQRILAPPLPEITDEDLESAGVGDREPAYTPLPKP